MKQLILVRHGKSSWQYDVIDKERPLKKRGINDAKRVSAIFNTKTIVVDAVFSSPANRALSTCKIFIEELKISESKLKINEDLYDFSGERVLNFIKKMDDRLDTVMIFGHNHALTAIVNTYGDRYINNLPTSGLAILEFNIDNWKHLKLGHTKDVLFPRDYR
ncbi:SixA phosphatase family protein [Winogradskyella immobilis]|uniref:Histidine phosphatase family protein n=1 Tax=Winogradskyella immobilis TaxID=2816852 RepID=A0ABS8ERH1_9FLAO|nr:histidine phosphatase family protein [Winogradskyella immobilis]MCC1485612.1 histidine phosphatase family protein [Winogradskyella immobilis]MCG0017704.1 histidine phosphatase family protein [Winogradskyella immobilis]